MPGYVLSMSLSLAYFQLVEKLDGDPLLVWPLSLAYFQLASIPQRGVSALADLLVLLIFNAVNGTVTYGLDTVTLSLAYFQRAGTST